jgi:hypothetical protein
VGALCSVAPVSRKTRPETEDSSASRKRLCHNRELLSLRVQERPRANSVAGPTEPCLSSLRVTVALCIACQCLDELAHIYHSIGITITTIQCSCN